MTRFVRGVLLLAMLGMALLAELAGAQTCGFIPSAYPLYGADLTVGSNGKVNGKSIVPGNYDYSGINPATGAVENALPSFPAINPAFPNFSATNTQNLNAGGTLSSGTFGTVNVTGNATMRGNFQIKTLNVAGVTLTIQGGDFFIETLNLANNAQIVTTSQTRLYVKTLVSVGNSVNLNASGSVGNFQLYLYDGAQFSAANRNNLVLKGVIYGVNASVDVGNNAAVTGMMTTSGSLVIGNNAALTYDNATQGVVGSISTCNGLVVEYRFEEASWNGTAGEVKDTSGRGLNGRRLLSASPSVTNTVVLPTSAAGTPPNVPTIAQSVVDQNLGFTVSGDFCRSGRFDGNGVVEAGASTLFDLTTQHTAMAWIYPTSTPGALNSIVSNDRNYEFHLTSGRKLNWWWNDAANATRDIYSTGTIPLNRWTHVALTYDQGRQVMYINGVLDNSWAYSGVLSPNGCNFYIAGDVATGSCSIISDRNFRGLIDEVRVFNTALTQAEVQSYLKQGRACTPPARFLITVEDVGECAKKVTITALDSNGATLTAYDGTIKLASSTAHGDWTLQSGKGQLGVGLADSGQATYTFRPIAGDAGVVTLILSNSRTESLTFTVEDSTSAASRTTSDSQTFKPCLFNCVEAKPYVADTDARVGRLYTKVAGEDFGFDVVALTALGVPNKNYNKQVKVELVDAGNAAQNCATWPAATGITGMPATFTFSPAADKGRHSFSALKASTAYRNLRCRATIVSTSEQACSSDNFAIRPADFAATATVTSPLAAGDASNMPSSGDPFTMVATARSKAAAPTTVAGYDGIPKIDQALVAATASGPNIAGTVTSSLPQISGKTVFPAAVAGVSTGTNSFAYSEVGVFSLAATAIYDDDWTNVDQGSDCTDDFSNSLDSTGKYGCKFGSSAAINNIGRFVPGRLSAVAPTLAGACTASGFIYMDQPFDLGFTLKALAKNGAVTQNFDNSYLVASGTGLPTVASPSAYGAAYLSAVDSGVDSIARVTHIRVGTGTNAGRILSAAGASASWTKGVLDGAAISLSGALFTKSAFPPSATNDLPREAMQFGLKVDTGSDAVPVTPAAIGAQTRIRYGRLSLSNAYGSELLPLRVPVLAQYWTAGGWLRNQLDSCTQLTLPTSGNGGLIFYAPPSTSRNALVVAKTTAALPPSGLLSSGEARLVLSAPGTGNYGFVDVVAAVLLNSGSPATSAWLSATTPKARACFGTCGPRSPIIYQRERY